MALVLQPDGMLPAGKPHATTLDEIHEVFVDAAPFKDERELIFRGLELYVDLVSRTFDSARLWINGGFTTHKKWAAPKDVDVATILPIAEFPKAISDEAMSLWTLLGVSAQQPTFRGIDRVQPLGGLLDSFFIPDIDAHTLVWSTRWQRVKGQDGNIVEGAAKGFLEVVL